MKSEIRNCGVLLHPTSLPSRHGIGSLGEKAYEFISLMKEMKITLWQILPLGPTGFGDSPYASRSTFAGNELLIDLNELAFDEYLDLTDIIEDPFELSDRIDYNLVREFKEPLLRKAALNLIKQKDKKAYNVFIKNNAYWLDDYALYCTLVKQYNDSRWYYAWPEKIKKRDEKTLKELIKANKEEIEIVKAIQFFFLFNGKKLKI